MPQTLFLQRDSTGAPKRFAIRCGFADKELVKKAGSGCARWSKTEGVWTMPPDPVLLKRMMKLFPDAVLTPELLEYVDQLYQKQKKLYLASTVTDPVGDAELFEYQNSSVRVLEQSGNIILGHRMGLGKTPIACAAVNYTGASKVIVVCPSSVKWSWVDHMIEWGNREDLYVLESGKVKTDLATVIHDNREDALVDLLTHTKEFVLLMSYDMMRMYAPTISKFDYDVIIFDESHKLKNRKAMTTQAAISVSKSCARRWLLTGTPIRNSYTDLYTLLALVDPVRFSSYWNFVNTYMDTVPNLYGGTDIIGLRDEEEFNSMMSVYMYRLTQEDVYDEIPPIIRKDIKLFMSEEQQKIYDSMETELLVAFEKELEEGNSIEQVVSAPNTVAQLMRLRQICLSPSLIGGPEESTKLQLLMELIEDLIDQDEKIVVFSCFKGFVDLISKELVHRGIDYGLIVGGKSSSARHKVEQALNEGEFPVVLGTVGAMGEGMNLQSANTAIFTDIDWVPANNEQAEERIGHRGGIKKESPRIIRLYHPDTVEMDIRATCNRKEKIKNEAIGSAETIRNLILRREK